MMKAVRVIGLLRADRSPAGAVGSIREKGEASASGPRRSTRKVRAAVTPAQHRLGRMAETPPSGDAADRSAGPAGRGKAGCAAVLQRTARAERTSRSVPVRDIGRRARVGPLARADLADAGRAELGSPSGGRKQRQDRSE